MHGKVIEIEDARLGPLQRCVMGRPDSTCLPEVPSFVGANEEEKGGIEDADGGDVYLVEPARRKDELEWDQDEESEEVEGRTIGEDCVGFDSLESEHGSTKLDFCVTVGDDLREGIREHGNENCEKERVA